MSRGTSSREPYVLTATTKGVTTLTMNRPRRFNGWTMEMMNALKEELRRAASDATTKVVILTGKGRYYCAGVNLGGTLQPAHPKKLHAMIINHNRELFETFLDFPKPLLIAVNGPVIGAATTSATLADGIIAAQSATFSTPFAALSISPEGCSSVHFARLMGAANAERMLGAEGWKPTAKQAKEVGLIQWVAPDGELLSEAQKIAETWAESGIAKRFSGPGELEEMKAVNAAESVRIADSFLSAPFMKAQFKFLWGKKKRGPAGVFFALWVARPFWSRLL